MSSGDGGKVILWADDATYFYGGISAVGGIQVFLFFTDTVEIHLYAYEKLRILSKSDSDTSLSITHHRHTVEISSYIQENTDTIEI